MGEQVAGVDVVTDARGEEAVRCRLASGKRVVAERALYSIGRSDCTARLNLEAAGAACDGRRRIPVNEHYQTCVKHIYAAGDVVGFPSLASTSMEQGRCAARHACGFPTAHAPACFPYGIYTIPEIRFVGRNEAELTRDGVAYEVGKAMYREIARGQIVGDEIGLLKLLFDVRDRRILGVHIIGEGAAELVHIGQAVLAFAGTLDYFIDTVLNYPTLAETYKNAALDGLTRLGG